MIKTIFILENDCQNSAKPFIVLYLCKMTFKVSEKHEVINCSRCSNTIECKANSPWLCDCNSISLNRDEVQFIEELFFEGCLCASCLKELKAAYQAKTI